MCHLHKAAISFNFNVKVLKVKQDLMVGNGSRKWLDYIVDYVKNTKISYNHFNRWLIYRKKSDKIWKQNFNQYFKKYQIIDDNLVRVES